MIIAGGGNGESSAYSSSTRLSSTPSSSVDPFISLVVTKNFIITDYQIQYFILFASKCLQFWIPQTNRSSLPTLRFTPRMAHEIYSSSQRTFSLPFPPFLFQFYIKKFYIFLWSRMSPMLNGGTFEEIYRFSPLFLGYLLWWPIH